MVTTIGDSWDTSFYFTQIEVAYVLFIEAKSVEITQTIEPEFIDVINETGKMTSGKDVINPSRNYENDNLTYKGMMLHYVSNVPFEVYRYMKSTKDIWNSLKNKYGNVGLCLLYTSPSPRDGLLSRMPSSA